MEEAAALAVLNHTTCGHTSLCTASWPSEAGPTTICEACYQQNKETLNQIWVETNERVIDTGCAFDCGSSSPLRLYSDLNLPICDLCMERNHQALLRAEASYAPKAEIAPQALCSELWIGPKEAAYSREQLQRLGIGRVLVCCDSLQMYHSGDSTLRYHRLPVKDSVTQDLGQYFSSAFAYIAQGRLEGTATLVHCNAGASRSGAIAVAWLAYSQGLSAHTALAQAKLIRPQISPNSAFWVQLQSRFP
jgi:hypothetical protein